MKRFLILVVLCVFSVASSRARLGETPKQIYDRYGGRVLWSNQVSGAGILPEKSFLRDGNYHSYMFEAKEIASRVGLVICYQTDEMEQIQVYYDRVTTNSIAEIFCPRTPYPYPRSDGSARLLNPTEQREQSANYQHVEKMAMLIGPKAANVSDFEECPFHKRTYFSKTAPRVLLGYRFDIFGVAELSASTVCFLEYSKKIKSVADDLKKAKKY